MTVNSVCHGDYSIKGIEIQINMFDDRLVFETPGRLPGTVRADSIRHTHFSRNPKIAEYLKAYDYVKEFGEGVDRMCRELVALGVQEPKYHLDALILKTSVYANKLKDITETTQKTQRGITRGKKKDKKKARKGQEELMDKIIYVIKAKSQISVSSLSKECEISVKTARNNIERLRTDGIIKRVGPDKGGRWEFVDKGDIK